jgi:glycosyltransferase involved in cell wall biosynthesis
MKINIIFPYSTWGGAFRSTYELANHMAARGESVELYIPFFPYLDGAHPLSRAGMGLLIRGLGRSLVRWNRTPWFDLKVPLKMVPVINDRFIRDADVVMANHWPTAYSVARLSPSKGRKFHFIRDTELDLRGGECVGGTYKLPLARIVVADWLGDYLQENHGAEVCGVVTNGLSMRDFAVLDKRYNDPPTICMAHRDGDPRKGMSDGFEALARVKERHPEVKIVLFGWTKPRDIPVEAEFHLRPVGERLRAIYAQSDIFLWTSLQEGFGNPPREAMAAGCAVVATNVGCIPDCTIQGETALVVEPGDVGAMIEAICGLVEDPGRIRALGRRGYEHIQQFTWEKAATRLLKLFRAN